MKHIIRLIFLIFSYDCTWGSNCGPEFKGCTCGDVLYQDQIQYVVNCTNTGFTDTAVLQHLPDEIQVLIFTGNSIPQLPWNVFGNLKKNYSRLRIVDMSNNKIHEILGKSYHRVWNVERLVLNHNNISISPDESYNYHHPRIFSSFINLKELHLTDAFADKSKNLARDLHDIFVNSNLTKLIKLHLEQNEISNFQDRKVFCDLPSLMDLHLGSNLLTGLDFDIDCLKHLRFIDLEQNKIKVLTSQELEMLDELPARNQNLTLDLRNNPFSCECAFSELFDWFSVTKVNIREKDFIHCIHYRGTAEEGTKMDCIPKVTHFVVTSPHNKASEIVLGFLLVVLIGLFLGIIYANRRAIKYKLNPLIDNVSRKVYYTTIGHDEDQEVEV